MGLGPTTVKTVRLDVNRKNLAALSDLLESGVVRVVIDRTYPLEQAGEAVGHVLGHHTRGKVVITV
jgi:NADPH:quinone reductase-like Zn-dependent oxidoreductase